MSPRQAAGIAICLLLAACGNGELPPPSADLVMALQDTQVTLQDFRDWVGRNVTSARYEDLSPRARSRLLDQMLEERILLHAAREAGIRVDEAEVEAYLNESGGRGQVRDPEFRREVRDRLSIKRYREERLMADLTLEDDEMRAWYEAHRVDYTEPGRYLVRHIFLDKEKAVQKAWERLEAGERFEIVAAELNISAMRERPHLVRVADLSPVLAEALAGLEPGQNTEPVQSAEGFHILRLDEVLEGGPRDFEEVREQVEMDLLRAKSADRIEETIEEMTGQEPFLFMPENLDFQYVP